MRFQPHGKVQVQVQGNVLFVDATGPFNEHAIIERNPKLQDAYKELQGAEWAQILIVHGQGLMTPEAEKELINSLSYRKSIGLQKSIVVVGDAELTAVMKEQISRCYKASNLPYQFVDQIEDAEAALTAYLGSE